MALILKAGKTYTATLGDAFGFPMVGGDFYGAIDCVNYDKGDKRCSWSVNIYANSASRTALKSPIDVANFSVEAADFDSDIGSSGFTIIQAYVYSLSQAGFAHWESDE